MKLQHIKTEQKGRVESGPVQFNEDWPGTFIRGDDAGWCAFMLNEFITKHKDSLHPLMELGPLQHLLNLLESSRVGNHEE